MDTAPPWTVVAKGSVFAMVVTTVVRFYACFVHACSGVGPQHPEYISGAGEEEAQKGSDSDRARRHQNGVAGCC